MQAFSPLYLKIGISFESVLAIIKRNFTGGSNNTFPIAMIITACLTLLSCWMPWVMPNFIFGPNIGGVVLLGPDDTGWNGSLKLMGVTIPNWTTGCCAAVIAILSLVKIKGIIRGPELIPLILALYGLLHTGAIIIELILQNPVKERAGAIFLGTSYNSLGIGIILAFTCFIALLFLSNRPLRMGIRRVYDACCKSLVWSRCHTLYIQVVGIVTKRWHTFIIIVLACVAFISCLIISYFYDYYLEVMKSWDY
jgi:hypothetical protein